MTDYWKAKEAVAEFERYWNKENKDSLIRRWGLVERLAKGSPRSSVLDVGCGIGNLIAFTSLATEGNYLGIDISSSMVERARVLHPKFRFEVVDPMEFTTPHDLVVAHGFLLHQHDPFVKLRKLTELTKSRLIFDMLVTNEGYSRRSPKGYWTRVLGDEEYVSVKGELAAGFSLEEVKFGEWSGHVEYYLRCERKCT